MTALSPEQEQALNALLALVPRPAPAPKTPPQGADFLQTWLGISGGDVQARLSRYLQQKDDLEKRALDWVHANPLDANFEFLAGCAWVFYRAEKGQNPRIQTFIDSFYYIATCASVGYADIFAVTQTGRAVAALVMVVGPALTNKALDRPSPDPDKTK